MDKKSSPKTDQSLAGKIFFLVFFLLIAGSVAVTYWRIMVKRDYIISAQMACDPVTETCFVSSCDPESDEECANTPEEERTTYYKTINKNAKNIPPCDPYKNECPEELSCESGEEDCEIILCDAENVPEGEECNDPVAYAAENASSEDETSTEKCDCNEPGDETAAEVPEGEKDPNCVCDQGEPGDEAGAGENENENSEKEDLDNPNLNGKIDQKVTPQRY